MRGQLVAVDLETTGLNPAEDEIIEVAAVRLQDGEIIDTYSTFVDPGRPIPSQITYITGIQQDDVSGAPVIKDVLPRISEFVGKAPVIAHNISFDMGFLQERHRILPGNQRIDTYDLASVLLPQAPRYNLNSLTQQVGIELENAHRALDDTRATALLYWELWKKALALPPRTLEEIVHAGGHLQWDSRIVFEAALREAKPDTFGENGSSPQMESDGRKSFPVLKPNAQTVPLSQAQITPLFDESGAFAQHIPGYEHRQQQQDMALAVANAFNNTEHLMIEAGTGTGKSFAYLVPAILWATRNNRRVVISTETINLQEQLLRKDIPLLKDALGIDFAATIMKGRGNYLSPQRFEVMRRRGPSTLIELRTFAKILVWLLENNSGDKGQINLRGPEENSIWQQLSAEFESNENGPTLTPFQRARQQADSAHIIIVNHALLVSDALSDQHVLPEYDYAIVDEAHHLEDAITRGASTQISYPMLKREIASLGGTKRGLLGEILAQIRRSGSEKDARNFTDFIEGIEEVANFMDAHLSKLYEDVEQFLVENQIGRPGEFSIIARIKPAHRESSSFAVAQNRWRNLTEFFDTLADAMGQLQKGLKRLDPERTRGLRELASHIAGVNSQLEAFRHQLHEFLIEPDANRVYWIRAGQTVEHVSIHSAPVNVGGMIEDTLWSQKRSVVLTSATLRTGDNFDYIRQRLHAENVEAIELGSPFNYHDSTLIYLPTDIPEPSDRDGYQQTIERAIIEMAAALDGRVMALFTSYNQLRQTAQAIAPRLALGNINLYDQSDGTSRENLLDGFKSDEKAVLLGTRSFWEGVDIPGDSLSCLLITRLPFMVPSDPVFSARSDTYTNAFNQYALPEAILRFRQGFGRLIRRSTDRGVVVITDKRILTKGYGKEFIASLPDCTVQKGALRDVAAAAQDWLNLTTQDDLA